MENKTIIRKLIAHAEKLIKYCGPLASHSQFFANPMLVEACVFNLSQMGELVNKLDDSFLEEHPDIPWRALYGLRNRIIHDYEGVNFNLVWDIIKDDLPGLIIKLESLS